jgi:PAS domain S-box-containing protein
MTTNTDEAGSLAALQERVAVLERTVAERDAALERLRDSEQMFRTLVASAKDFIFLVDREGTVRYVNDFGARALGRSQPECIGLSHSALFHTDGERQHNSLNRVFESGTELYIETVTQFPHGELCLDTRLVPVRNARGQIDMVLGVSRDSTARKAAIHELQYRIKFEEIIATISRQFINLPVDRMDDTIREALAALGNFVGADRCSVRLYSDERDRIDLVHEWQHPDVKGVHSSSTTLTQQVPWGMAKLQAHGPVLIPSVDDLPPEASHDAEVLRSLGIRSLAVVPLLYSGEHVGMLTLTSVRANKYWSTNTVALLRIAGEVFSNALARKRTDEDLRKMADELVRIERIESIGILAGGIAHDFNNILAAIWGNISLARVALPRTDEALARLSEAERALMRAKDLAQQLLTFSRGGQPVKRLVALPPLIEESAGFATRGSSVQAAVDASGEIWAIEADRGQIARVLHNLLINAVQAMPTGGTVTVRARNSAITAEHGLPLAPGPYVHIVVEDQGTGIADEHVPKLFVPYFTTKERGSGLGLATSYNIVRKHGGLITFETQVGKGTAFSIHLPATPEKRGEDRKEDPSIRRGSGRVLLVDDEEPVRASTSAMLRHLGYEADTADSGESAVRMFAKALQAGTPYAAVLMDLVLPGGVNGREAFEQIRALDARVPGIISSGYSNDPVMSEYERYGFRGVIRKPYSIKELGHALHAVLGDPEARTS